MKFGLALVFSSVTAASNFLRLPVLAGNSLCAKLGDFLDEATITSIFRLRAVPYTQQASHPKPSAAPGGSHNLTSAPQSR
jgi:hypothetical protein